MFTHCNFSLLLLIYNDQEKKRKKKNPWATCLLRVLSVNICPVCQLPCTVSENEIRGTLYKIPILCLFLGLCPCLLFYPIVIGWTVSKTVHSGSEDITANQSRSTTCSWSHMHGHTHTPGAIILNITMLSAVATLTSSSKWIFTSSNAGYWNNLKSILVYTAVYLVELFLLSQRFSWSFKAKDKL